MNGVELQADELVGDELVADQVYTCRMVNGPRTTSRP